MAFTNKLKGIGSALRLDSHHTIERFGVMVVLLLTTGLLITGSSMAYSIDKHRARLGTQAIYTTDFTTSKTNVKGQVAGVYRSEDRTRAMLLLKFEDVSKISTEAAQYQSFLTATDLKVNKQKPAGTPTGSVYLFGRTGYMGIYLVNAQHFSSQILSLTLRAKAEIVTPTAGTQKDVDGSFAKYDQWRVFFNPGAKDATVIPALANLTPDVTEMFDQMVVAKQEQDVRAKLDDQLKKMQTDLAAINEYQASLSKTSIGTSGVKVIPPNAMEPSTVPEAIAGDEVTGSAAVGNMPSSLKLVSDHVLSGGYDFDWRPGSVGKGYLDSIVPSDMDYITYLSKQATATAPQIDVSAEALKWTMTNGQLLRYMDQSNVAYKPVNDIVLNLTNAYTAYFADKKLYELSMLPQLLDLEVQLRDVEANSTVNVDTKAVVVY